MTKKIKILYIDDNPGDRALVRDVLEKEHDGFSLTLTKSKTGFEKQIRGKTFDLVLTDFNILGFEGLQVLKLVAEVSPETPVIIVTGTGSEEIAVEAMKQGAWDYVIKTQEHILRLPKTIHTVLERKKLLDEQQKSRKQLEKLNRIYALISQINQLIVRTKNREDILRQSCEIAIKYGKFRMAWIGIYDKGPDRVKPTYWAGFEEGYLSDIKIVSSADAPEGKGPTAKAFLEKRYVVCNDIENDPEFGPWRAEALKRGYFSSIALPVTFQGKAFGTFNLYADETNFFDQQEVALLVEVVSDISFALDTLHTEKEHKKGQKELEAQKKRLQQFFDEDISGDYISDTSGKLITCNNTFLKIFGFKTTEEAHQYPLEKLYLHTSKRETFIDLLKKKKRIKFFENELRTVDGRKITVLQNVTGTFNDAGELTEMRGYIVDITPRVMAQAEIRKLSRAVEQSPETIIITDKEGKIEYVNPAFTKVTGYTMQEVIGENPGILGTHEKSQDEYKELWETILSGNTWRGEFHNRKKNGERYWEQASISPIKNPYGEITHFVAIKEDITERKAKDIELKMALEKARESDRLKSAFLANMSHEIRTPMNGILGFAELLKEPKLGGEQQREYLDIIERSANRMLNIITDIVNISKIEAGLMDVHISETNMNKEVEFLHSFFEPEVKLHGIKLFSHKPLSDKASVILTDREKVYGVLMNLIKNAIKFTSEGSIEFGYEKKGEFLEFFVKDTGIGISDEIKDIIFERFRQGSESLTRNYEGAGLGLSISKAYVELLGGKIWFESKCSKIPGEHGTDFYFTIPYQPLLSKQVAKKGTKSITSEKSHSKKFKILIAEDDEVSETLLKYVLEPIAHDILNVPNGELAVEICKQNPDIDVILMDIRMPKMDGYEATKRIRKFNKDVLIIAQTAFALEGDREKALEAGCNDYITKPIELDKFRVILKKFNLE